MDRDVFSPRSNNAFYTLGVCPQPLTSAGIYFLTGSKVRNHAKMILLEAINPIYFMPKKSPNDMPEDVADILKFIVTHIDERFDRVDERFNDMHRETREIKERLDRMEFLLAGQERRISTLEDRMRMVATKLGLEFRPQS